MKEEKKKERRKQGGRKQKSEGQMKEFRKKELVKIETNINLSINKIIPAKLFKTQNSQENKAAKQNKLNFLFLNNKKDKTAYRMRTENAEIGSEQ